jgi:hypothetical protein
MWSTQQYYLGIVTLPPIYSDIYIYSDIGGDLVGFNHINGCYYG